MGTNKYDDQPLVSIIVPCYNHERYITECIESIINQTYKNIELTVIDDGSRDNSLQVLNELKKKYKLNLVSQENHGIAFTLNRGIKEFSSGKYLTFCASDDFWTPTKIEKQVDFLENNYFYPMCYGKTFYVNEESTLFEDYDNANRHLKGGWLFEDIILFKIHPPVNYMFRTRIFEELGYYDEEILAEDYYMNLKISNKYPIGFIDEFLGYYRLTELTAKVERWELVSNSHLKTIELFKENDLYERAKAKVYLRNFELFARYKKHKVKAISYLLKSISLFYDKLFILACISLIFKWKKN